MTELRFKEDQNFALELDRQDPLTGFREEFLFPDLGKNTEAIYLAGNSLGLQPRKTRSFIQQELDDWARWGVEGHFHAKNPWLPYHENLTEQTARLVGAKPIEVVVMNTLSVNLHLMMVSFYRPNKKRFKILVEGGAFPSDQYAVASQARFHGFDPKEAILEIKPRPGENLIREEDLVQMIQDHGQEIALILIGNVNYLTGQAFNIKKITQEGHAQGCLVGFDLAHGAGNLLLNLHQDAPDFSVWCSYKYLNSGPGALSGCFIHERHAHDLTIPRFAGWWGQNKKTRFQMGPNFEPIPGAEGWQLSNPPIFQLAALRASMNIFDQATMPRIREKSEKITGYLEYLLSLLPQHYCQQITPSTLKERGAQISIKIQKDPKSLLKAWLDYGVVCDFREPDIIRITPAPLYVRYIDIFHLFEILKNHAK